MKVISTGKDNAERASMNYSDVEPRLTLIEILSDFRGKLLIAGRLNEKVPRPMFRRFSGAAPRAHFTHPRFPNVQQHAQQ